MSERKRPTMIHKTQHRKLKIEQHKPYQKPWVNSGALEGLAVSTELSLFQNSYLSSTIRIWNSLGTNIKEFTIHSRFK